jgi:hypothetical protein
MVLERAAVVPLHKPLFPPTGLCQTNWSTHWLPSCLITI